MCSCSEDFLLWGGIQKSCPKTGPSCEKSKPFCFFAPGVCPGLDAWCLTYSLYNYIVTPSIFLYCVSSLSCALSPISALFMSLSCVLDYIFRVALSSCLVIIVVLCSIVSSKSIVSFEFSVLYNYRIVY